MSPPCAPVVSLKVSTVCQPASDASVGRDDLGIGATVGVAVLVGITVGVAVGTSVVVVVGAGVDAPKSEVFGLAGAAPHAASSMLASGSAAMSQITRRDTGDALRDDEGFRTESRILPHG